MNDVVSQSVQKVQPPCVEHVLREDEILLRTGPEAYVFISNPRSFVSVHQCHVCWWDQEIGFPNTSDGFNIDGVLYCVPGEDYD